MEVKIETKITGYSKQKYYTVLSFVPHGPMVKASGYDFVSTSRLEPEDSRFDSWWGSLHFFWFHIQPICSIHIRHYNVYLYLRYIYKSMNYLSVISLACLSINL